MSAGTNRIITPLIMAFVLLTSIPTFAGRIIYVDDDGPADFNNIQTAIYAAYDGDTVIIADGIYTGPGHRYIDFLGKAITVRSENGPGNCSIDCQGTGRGFCFRNGEDANSVLEGFTITNGYESKGGGIYCEASSPTITSCIVTVNSATLGGGMFNNESCPSLTNCIFSGNSAKWCGGMYNIQSGPILNNCSFSGNSAKWGGGVEAMRSRVTLTNCAFSGNSAIWGGGMLNSESFLTLTNCTFKGNMADYGGGMDNFESISTLTNCTFSGNSGGGMNNDYCNPMIINCLFSGNYGSGIVNSQSSVWLINCTIAENFAINVGGIHNHSGTSATIINCIIWGNYWDELTGDGFEVSYSDIQGGWPGEGNIDTDPCFVDPGYWDSNDTPDYTMDDFWIEGNYHLLPDSPCINAGDPNCVAEPNEIDLDGNPRILGDRIDMGAYEYSPAIMASVRIVPRTINLASKGKWISCYIWLPEDYNVVDIEPNSVFFERKIEPQQLWFNEEEHVVIAKFSLEQLQGILNIGLFKLSIFGWLKDRTVFEGIDVIRIIDEGGGKLAKFGKASNPNPADGATNVGIDADLSWMAGSDATSHDLYFGTSSSPPFVCNQTDASFDPGKMATSTKYFWRIDEVNKWGKITGDLWSFTTYRWPIPPPPPPPPP